MNFAKLSKTAPKRRMAAALSGFGMGTAYSTQQHLQSLGLVTALSSKPLTVVSADPAPQPDTVIPKPPQKSMALLSPDSPPFVMNSIAKAALLQQGFDSGVPVAKAALAPLPRPPLEQVDSVYSVPNRPPKNIAIEDGGITTSGGGRRDPGYTFAEGRKETINYQETEEVEEKWPMPEEVRRDEPAKPPLVSVEARPLPKTLASVSASVKVPGGIVARVASLPMPVKIGGALLAAYVVYKVVAK